MVRISAKKPPAEVAAKTGTPITIKVAALDDATRSGFDTPVAPAFPPLVASNASEHLASGPFSLSEAGAKTLNKVETFLKSSPAVTAMSVSSACTFISRLDAFAADVAKLTDSNAHSTLETLSTHRKAATSRMDELVEPTRERIRCGEYGLDAIRADLDTHGDVFVLIALGTDMRVDYRDRQNAPPSGQFHRPSRPRGVLEALLAAKVGSGDTLYDLGSGSGQVPFLAHLATGARCKGVEYDQSLHQVACENSRNLHLSAVELIRADAAAVDYSDGTAFYLFQPFFGPVLSAVLERLRKVASSQPITLVTCAMPLKEPWLLEPEVTKSGYLIYRSKPT